MLVRRFIARVASCALFVSTMVLGVPPQRVVMADAVCGAGEECVEATVGLVTSIFYNAGGGKLVCALTSLVDDLDGSNLIDTDGDSTLETGENAVAKDLGTATAKVEWTPRSATAVGTRVDITATWGIDTDGAANGSCDGGTDETGVGSSGSLVYSTRVVNAYDATSDSRIKIFVAEDGGAGDTPLNFTFSGRGSWSQSTPLYVLGDMVKVQPLTSVTVTGLVGMSVRAQIDFNADGVFGTASGVERPANATATAVTCDSNCSGVTAISVAAGDAGTWERAWDDNNRNSTVDAGEIRQSGSADIWYYRVTDTGADGKVTFDLNLHQASKAAFGGFINIEVDADKQTHGFNRGNGDVAFSFNLFTQPLVGFDESQPPGNEFVVKATDSASAFKADTYRPQAGFTYDYLDPVPLCSANGSVAPCLNSIDSGWALRLRDSWMPAFGQAEMLTITPYRNTSPYEVDAGDTVEFALRLPTGDVRFQCWGVADNPAGSINPCSTTHTAAEGLSTANASSYFNTFTYDASDPSYGVVSAEMEIRSATRVLTFGSSQATDECQGNLNVGTLSNGATGVYLDADLDGVYDAGEEAVEPCQNQSSAIYIDKVLVEPGKAWVKTKSAHGLATNDRVTICCIGAPFDGTHTAKIVVADPSGAADPGRYFYINTTGGEFELIDWRPLYGLNVDDGETRSGVAARGSSVRIAETSLGTEIMLNRPPLAALAGGFVTTNAQAFAFGPNMLTGQAFDFGVAGPSYTATNEQSRSQANRRGDGFFQVCIPSGFVSGVFGLTVASAVSALQTTRSDAGGAAAAVSPSATASTCGVGAGLKLELNNFGFSAPYFNTSKASVASSAPAVEVATPAPVTATPVVATPAPASVKQLPPRRIPGRGAVVQLVTAPPAALGSAVGMKASKDSVSVALRIPSLGVNKRAAEYVISLVVPGKGVVKQITVKAGASGSTISAVFPNLSSGRYAIRVVGKSKDGSQLGRWRSPTVRLRN